MDRGHLDPQMHTEGEQCEDMGKWHVQDWKDESIHHRRPNIVASPQWQERGKEEFSDRFQKEHGQANTPCLQISGLETWEGTDFSSGKSPTLWNSVTAALGNRYADINTRIKKKFLVFTKT